MFYSNAANITIRARREERRWIKASYHANSQREHEWCWMHARDCDLDARQAVDWMSDPTPYLTAEYESSDY